MSTKILTKTYGTFTLYSVGSMRPCEWRLKHVSKIEVEIRRDISDEGRPIWLVRFFDIDVAECRTLKKAVEFSKLWIYHDLGGEYAES